MSLGLKGMSHTCAPLDAGEPISVSCRLLKSTCAYFFELELHQPIRALKFHIGAFYLQWSLARSDATEIQRRIMNWAGRHQNHLISCNFFRALLSLKILQRRVAGRNSFLCTFVHYFYVLASEMPALRHLVHYFSRFSSSKCCSASHWWTSLQWYTSRSMRYLCTFVHYFSRFVCELAGGTRALRHLVQIFWRFLSSICCSGSHCSTRRLRFTSRNDFLCTLVHYFSRLVFELAGGTPALRHLVHNFSGLNCVQATGTPSIRQHVHIFSLGCVGGVAE